MTDSIPDPFDFVDDDFIEAVVSVAATLPGREPDHVPAVRSSAPARRTRRDSEYMRKIDAALDRLRKAGAK
jgi:hypothetical protein